MPLSFGTIAARTWDPNGPEDGVIDLTSDSPRSLVPYWYNGVLSSFLSKNPYDFNFEVILEDNGGFGSVFCLEDGDCNYALIELGKDPRVPDGGRSRGLGFLAEYAQHCREPSHVRARDARVASTPAHKLPDKAALPSPASSIPDVSPSVRGLSPVRFGAAASSKASDWGSSLKAKTEPMGPPSSTKASSSKTTPFKSVASSSSSTPLSSPAKLARASSSDVKHKPTAKVESKRTFYELSDSSDDEMDDRATLDKFLGLHRKAKVVVKKVKIDEMEEMEEMEVEVEDVKGKGKERQVPSSDKENGLESPVAGPSKPAMNQKEFMKYVNKDLKKVNKRIADRVAQEKLEKREEQERKALSMQERLAAKKEQVEAPIAGPSNCGVPTAAAAAAADADPPFHEGPASPTEIALYREERDILTRLVTNWTSVHPAIKAANLRITAKFEAYRTRLRDVTEGANWSKKVPLLGADKLDLGAEMFAFTAGTMLVAFEPLHRTYFYQAQEDVRRLSGVEARLRGAYKATANAIAGAAVPQGLGYGGVLGGVVGVPGAYPGAANWNANGANGMGGLGGDAEFARLFGAGPGMEGVSLPVVQPNLNFRVAGDLKDFFDRAANDFGDSEEVGNAAEQLGLVDIKKDRMPGMNVILMAHQVVGVAWMINKEKEKRRRGGILADDMGLGKTVQMLAVMVARQSKDPKRRTNLVVAPLALLDQWALEIETKSSHNLKVHVQHGVNKLNSAKKLSKFDVVITTYGTLCGDYPDYKKHSTDLKRRKRLAKDKADYDSDDSEWDEQQQRSKLSTGPMAQMEWYRVILDEAQLIRNRGTRMANAAFRLNAEYKWALTGTPVTNALDDLFSLFNFIGLHPWNDWREFNEHIAKKAKKNPSLAASRAQAILKTCLLRRNKESKIDGKKLIELLPKHIHEDLLEFSPEERKIYDAIEARARAKFNKFLRAGVVLKNYSTVLAMLLRLRQAANHPALLVRPKHEIGPNDVVVDDDEEAIVNQAAIAGGVVDELKKAEVMTSAAWVHKQKASFLERAVVTSIAEHEGGDIDEDGYACPICMEDTRISQEAITACGHKFCRTCILDVLQQQQQHHDGDGEMNAGAKPCPSCRTPFDASRLFGAQFFEPTQAEIDRELKARGKYQGDDDEDMPDDDDDDDALDVKPSMGLIKRKTVKSESSCKGKSKSVARGRMLDSDDEDFVGPEDKLMSDPRGKQHKKKLFEKLGLEPEDEIIPSTKMIKLCELLRTMIKEHPEDKVIVYSQWTTMLDIVTDYLRKERLSYDMFDGRMNRVQREQTIKAFNVKQNPRILLISLKCGGVGLNLVRANRVINLDLAWNAATEGQARDRVHRLGQTKEVYVNRLIIANTVEQRILDLQDRKQKASDAALGEGSGAKLKRLTVKDLQTLFGG